MVGTAIIKRANLDSERQLTFVAVRPEYMMVFFIPETEQ
jgi:hypothetical protein